MDVRLAGYGEKRNKSRWVSNKWHLFRYIDEYRSFAKESALSFPEHDTRDDSQRNLSRPRAYSFYCYVRKSAAQVHRSLFSRFIEIRRFRVERLSDTKRVDRANIVRNFKLLKLTVKGHKAQKNAFCLEFYGGIIVERSLIAIDRFAKIFAIRLLLGILF